MPLPKFLRKPFSYVPLLIVMVFSIGQYSCDTGVNDPCGEEFPIDVYSERSGFRLINESGVSLIGITNATYHSSEVSVKYVNGEEVFGLIVGDDGSFGFFITDDGEEIERGYDKDFYLVLPPTTQFPEQDIDTISVEYRITEVECSKVYDFIDMKYNNRSYPPEGSNTSWEFLKE